MNHIALPTATYHYSPVEGCHLYSPADATPHPLFTERLLLHHPIHRDPIGNTLAAKGGDSQRACVWWVQLTPIPYPPNAFYSHLKHGETAYLLLWQQAEIGLKNPIRMWVIPLTEQTQKNRQFRAWLGRYLARLLRETQSKPLTLNRVIKKTSNFSS